MTAAAADRKAPQYGTPDSVLPYLINLPVAATTTIYAGTLVASDASGNAVPASASTALKLWGRAEAQVVNSGAAGAKTINVKPGVFPFNNSTGVDAIAAANVGSYCYVVDDNVVALTDGAGLRPIAGIIFPFDPNNTSVIQVGVGPGFTTPSNPNAPTPGGSPQFKARGVAYANVSSLAAFTVAATDLTFVAGDIVLLTAQTTVAQNGPYVVGTVASTTAPLTRPDWWAAGASIAGGQVIQVSEGTIWAGSEWKAFCGKAKVVDTDDPVFYPRVCKARVTLSSGTYALGSTEGLFLRSLTQSNVQATRETAGGTLTSTTHYYCPSASSGRVIGVSGTAVVTVNASVAAGTVNTADTSVMNVLVVNW
jgi:hypothetical protein